MSPQNGSPEFRILPCGPEADDSCLLQFHPDTSRQPLVCGVIGIDAGINGPASALTPGVAASSACMVALKAACTAIEMNPKTRIANCLVKQVTNVDVCNEEVRGLYVISINLPPDIALALIG